MKQTKIFFGMALCAALVISCATGGKSTGGQDGGISGDWTWGSFTDAANQGSSRISLIEDVEMINGVPTMTYSISGEITNQYEYGYAGWYAYPDDPTLDILQKVKTFTFKVIGDGQTYFVMLTTSDIEDAAYYRTTFTTKKDQEMTVTVRLGSLAQPDDWGIKKKFDQEFAQQIQWQTTNNGRPGSYKLKIWDIKLYP